MDGTGERMTTTDPTEIADEIVYGVDWNGLASDEFHPEVNLDKLHNAIVKAVREAYEQAAKLADAEQAHSIATAIRALKEESK